ncbi:MAG: hypothetical protein M3O32_20200 [Actinomycetota bacterium]|nr:hypothetical protein [Actinomycetota bacterium]
MKSTKIIAGFAIAVGLTAGAVGFGTGVANADPWPGIAPVPTRWGPPPQQNVPFPGGWNGGWEPKGGFCLGPVCI